VRSLDPSTQAGATPPAALQPIARRPRGADLWMHRGYGDSAHASCFSLTWEKNQKNAAAGAAATGNRRVRARRRVIGSEVPGDDQLHVARRLPVRSLAEVRAHHTRLRFVAAVHVEDGLPVEQVVDGEPGLEVNAFHRERPGDIRAEVVDPGHAAKGAPLGVHQLAGLPVAALRDAQPAGTAVAELVGETAAGTV